MEIGLAVRKWSPKKWLAWHFAKRPQWPSWPMSCGRTWGRYCERCPCSPWWRDVCTLDGFNPDLGLAKNVTFTIGFRGSVFSIEPIFRNPWTLNPHNMIIYIYTHIYIYGICWLASLKQVEWRGVHGISHHILGRIQEPATHWSRWFLVSALNLFGCYPNVPMFVAWILTLLRCHPRVGG